ncbi:MAG: sigma-70 family RNA polymerase sigma factor [Geodermatophilaceae bacterium]|nr:sigma-70 family RNA polymerase sigma factor [Geodermatophilaceae bacterium]
MSDEPESTLIERAKSDPDAFGELYEHYVDRIYNYIYYRVGNVDEAEELTSRLFYRVLKALPRYVDRGAPFASWLYRIAHNLVANFHRDQARRPSVPIDDLPLASTSRAAPERVAERHDTERTLWQAINALHEDRRQLLLLKFGDGLSNAQIGEVLGRTEGAVKSLYHRTLLALREEMEQRGYTRGADGANGTGTSEED